MVGLSTAILLLASALAPPPEAPVTGALSPEVGSLTAYPANDRYGAPVLHMGSGSMQPLVISFDLIGPERRYLRYSLTHCDASWRPDMLQPIEFADGFNEASVDDYAYSRATLIPYVNYRIELPGSGINPMVSGNYLLTVYDEETPSSPLARIPFMVSEDAAPLSISVTGRTDFDHNNAHQQLEVTADLAGLGVNDPWNDLRLVITQNNSPHDRSALTRPLRVNGTAVTYAHDPALTFAAGKEFRRFETVSVARYLPMGVSLVAFDDPWYHFMLYDDTPRAGHDYRYDQTQHGRFTVNADETSDPDTEAEYVKVHFALDLPEQPGALIMVDGELTGYRTDAQSPGSMTYNPVTGRYEAVLTLKQGSYNYRYTVVPHGGAAVSAPVEGDDYRTSNRYDVALYHRHPGARYDRLIGFATVVSGL